MTAAEDEHKAAGARTVPLGQSHWATGPPAPPSTGVARHLASLPKGVQQNPKV